MNFFSSSYNHILNPELIAKYHYQIPTDKDNETGNEIYSQRSVIQTFEIFTWTTKVKQYLGTGNFFQK